MLRLPQLFGLGIVALSLLVVGGLSQETKKEEKKEEKKAKGFMPPGFKDLVLSATQKDAIYKILSDYKSKISELDKQIKDLKKQEQVELFKVLTDEQKDKYFKSKGLDSKDKEKDKKEKEKEPEKK